MSALVSHLLLIQGRPCVDYLDDWESETSMLSLLVQIQTLLAFPVVANAVNMQAAEVYEKSPRLYDRLVLDCVIASRRIEGLSVLLILSGTCVD
jgi:ubiquitin-protein ligase